MNLLGFTKLFQEPVLIFNYRPSDRLLASVHSLVKEGGTFLFCTFNQKNRDNFSHEFSLKPAAYRGGIEHFELYAEPPST